MASLASAAPSDRSSARVKRPCGLTGWILYLLLSSIALWPATVARAEPLVELLPAGEDWSPADTLNNPGTLVADESFQRTFDAFVTEEVWDHRGDRRSAAALGHAFRKWKWPKNAGVISHLEAEVAKATTFEEWGGVWWEPMVLSRDDLVARQKRVVKAWNDVNMGAFQRTELWKVLYFASFTDEYLKPSFPWDRGSADEAREPSSIVLEARADILKARRELSRMISRQRSGAVTALEKIRSHAKENGYPELPPVALEESYLDTHNAFRGTGHIEQHLLDIENGWSVDYAKAELRRYLLPVPPRNRYWKDPSK